MATRVQVVLEEEERESFRRLAARRGVSLSAWLREAAREKRSVEETKKRMTPAELKAFFAECRRREKGKGREPDWEEHLAVMNRSRVKGIPDF